MPGAWFTTTRRQRRAYKRELSRMDEALSRQDVRGVGSPLARLRLSQAVGLGGVAGIVGMALVVSLIAPKPGGKVADIMNVRGKGMYVVYNGRLHPVTNLASARLIVGEPADAVQVGDDVLRKFPPGPLMGILNAPNALDARIDPVTTWTVCDWRDASTSLSLHRGAGLTTAVIAGADALSGGEDLGSTRALLVRSAGDPDRLWLIYGDTRAQVGRADFAAQRALGITPETVAEAQLVSDGLLGAISPSPALTAPLISDRGQPSTRVPGFRIGDVLATSVADGSRTFYAVGRDGVQEVGAVTADMLVATGSQQRLVDDPATLSSLPRVALFPAGHFPTQAPTVVPAEAVCWGWQQEPAAAPQTRVFTADRMPVTDRARQGAVTLMATAGPAVQATESVMTPGRGFYAAVVSGDPSSNSGDGLMWIDPSGSRYPIDADTRSGLAQGKIYDPTVEALGFSGQAPTPVPWAIARLYTLGSTLSIRDAQVLQGTINPTVQAECPAASGDGPPPHCPAPDAPAAVAQPLPPAVPPPPPPPSPSPPPELSGDPAGPEAPAADPNAPAAEPQAPAADPNVPPAEPTAPPEPTN